MQELQNKGYTAKLLYNKMNENFKQIYYFLTFYISGTAKQGLHSEGAVQRGVPAHDARVLPGVPEHI